MLFQAENISHSFGPVRSLHRVNLSLEAGRVHCLLGDNGAGKSTLIKVLSGTMRSQKGQLRLSGARIELRAPQEAMDMGIATVYQDLALLPLMSVARNFFLARELLREPRFLGLLDHARMEQETLASVSHMGIQLRSAEQKLGTLSGGEKQSIAIARALYFGARVLILDEPTSALGLSQAELVLQTIEKAAQRGVGVIFVTHNAHHALRVGQDFTILRRGEVIFSGERSELDLERLSRLMSGQIEA